MFNFQGTEYICLFYANWSDSNQTELLNNQLNVRTLEYYPSEPRFLTYYKTEDGKILIKWLSSETPNGIILKYNIFVNPLPTIAKKKSEADFYRSVDVQDSKVEYEVELNLNFSSYEEYSIWITAVNSFGKSERSNIIQVSNENTKFDEVKSIHSSKYEFDYTELKWEPVPTAAYYIIYYNSSMYETFVANTTEDSIKLKNLNPNSEYSIRIQPGNLKKTGEASNPFQLNLNNVFKSVNSKPKITSLLINESNSMNVSWSYDGFHNDFKNFKYLIKYGLNENDLKQKIVEGSSETSEYSALIDGLEPCEQYILIVQAFGENENKKVFSEPSEPSFFVTKYNAKSKSKSVSVKIINYTSIQLNWELNCVVPVSGAPSAWQEENFKKSIRFMVKVFYNNRLLFKTLTTNSILTSDASSFAHEFSKLVPGERYEIEIGQVDENDNVLSENGTVIPENLTIIPETISTIIYNAESYPKIKDIQGTLYSNKVHLKWNYPIRYNELMGFSIFRLNSSNATQKIKYTKLNFTNVDFVEFQNDSLQLIQLAVSIQDKYGNVGPISDLLELKVQIIANSIDSHSSTIIYSIIILVVCSIVIMLILIKRNKNVRKNVNYFISTHYNRVLDQATFFRRSTAPNGNVPQANPIIPDRELLMQEQNNQPNIV